MAKTGMTFQRRLSGLPLEGLDIVVHVQPVTLLQ